VAMKPAPLWRLAAAVAFSAAVTWLVIKG
jgi:hypothetical protein